MGFLNPAWEIRLNHHRVCQIWPYKTQFSKSHLAKTGCPKFGFSKLGLRYPALRNPGLPRPAFQNRVFQICLYETGFAKFGFGTFIFSNLSLGKSNLSKSNVANPIYVSRSLKPALPIWEMQNRVFLCYFFLPALQTSLCYFGFRIAASYYASYPSCV